MEAPTQVLELAMEKASDHPATTVIIEHGWTYVLGGTLTEEGEFTEEARYLVMNAVDGGHYLVPAVRLQTELTGEALEERRAEFADDERWGDEEDEG